MLEDKTEFRSDINLWYLRGLNVDGVSHQIASQGQTRVGRESDNSIVLVTGAVSRYHAFLEWSSDGLSLIDNKSANGTFVNGLPIEKALLRLGDKIRFDTVEFTLVDSLATNTTEDENPEDGTMMRPVPVRDVLLRGRDEPITSMLYRLDKKRYLIGRSPMNDIVIKAESVSSYHARLEKQLQHWVLVDENSSNGSFINGESIQQCQLNSGDVIRFGTVSLDFDPGEKTLMSHRASELPITSRWSKKWIIAAIGLVFGLLALVLLL